MILCILRVATNFTSKVLINKWINRQINRLQLGSQGLLQIQLSLQVVFKCCLCFAYCLYLYTSFTYSIVLTIIHFNSTFTLSFYNISVVG
jgi:hypothetical protein